MLRCQCFQNPFNAYAAIKKYQNKQGSFIGVVDETGCVIKVYDVETKSVTYEFNRGITSCKIESLRFDALSQMILLTNTKYTVHTFSLTKDAMAKPSWSSFLKV